MNFGRTDRNLVEHVIHAFVFFVSKISTSQIHGEFGLKKTTTKQNKEKKKLKEDKKKLRRNVC